MKKYFFLLIYFFLTSYCIANTINSRSCNQVDIQNAINISKDGDIISVPAGDCSWTSPNPVTVINKNIQIIGAGNDKTIIHLTKGNGFNFNISNKPKFRISGFNFTGKPTDATISVVQTSLAAPVIGWRIDNNKFDYGKILQPGDVIQVRGVSYGLIDHNNFIMTSGVAIILWQFLDREDGGGTFNNFGAFGSYSYSLPYSFGSQFAVYIEDNTFVNTIRTSRNFAVHDSSAGGGRSVFRYNKVTGGYFYVHWARNGEIGGQLNEIYNNTFIGNKGYDEYFARIEAGTGVIFNNTVRMNSTPPNKPYVMLDDRRADGSEANPPLNRCSEKNPWDGNGDSQAPGWPCYNQIGRSTGKTWQNITHRKSTSAPFYLWNNGIEAGCSSHGQCNDILNVFATPAAYIKSIPHPNGEIDYANHKRMPKYTPFIYPYPLNNGMPVVSH